MKPYHTMANSAVKTTVKTAVETAFVQFASFSTYLSELHPDECWRERLCQDHLVARHEVVSLPLGNV